jgi:hypothetical protein
VLPADLPDRLLPFAKVTLRNWAGRDVGEIRPEALAMPSAGFDGESVPVYRSAQE